jgi:hypothetical protein
MNLKINQHTKGIFMNDLDDFTLAYLEAAFFTSYDEYELNFNNQYTIQDINKEHLNEIKNECLNFQNENKQLLDTAIDLYNYNLKQAGHDFWLTRNGHGAGFFDRGLENIGKELTYKSHQLKESDLYLGDDNQLYFTNLPSDRNKKNCTNCFKS